MPEVPPMKWSPKTRSVAHSGLSAAVTMAATCCRESGASTLCCLESPPAGTAWLSVTPANAGALEAVRIDELRVIGGDVRGARLARSLPAERHAAGGRIAMIRGTALRHAQRHGTVGHFAAVRTDRVLRVRDRHYASAAGET